MLIVNLWIEAGLVDGVLCTVLSICEAPQVLSLALMVEFDNYSVPTFPIVILRKG